MTEKGGVQSVERIFQLIEQLASHPAGLRLLRGIAQADQACQQPVHGAFGKAGLLRQPLQAGPGRVGCQLFDQLEDALDALHAVNRSK